MAGSLSTKRSALIQQGELGQSFESLKFQREELMKLLEEQEEVMRKVETSVEKKRVVAEQMDCGVTVEEQKIC